MCFRLIWTSSELPNRKCAPALSTNFRDFVEDAAAAAVASSQGGESSVHPGVKWLLGRHLIEPEEVHVKKALQHLGVHAVVQPTIAFTS